MAHIREAAWANGSQGIDMWNHESFDDSIVAAREDRSYQSWRNSREGYTYLAGTVLQEGMELTVDELAILGESAVNLLRRMDPECPSLPFDLPHKRVYIPRGDNLDPYARLVKRMGGNVLRELDLIHPPHLVIAHDLSLFNSNNGSGLIDAEFAEHDLIPQIYEPAQGTHLAMFNKLADPEIMVTAIRGVLIRATIQEGWV